MSGRDFREAKPVAPQAPRGDEFRGLYESGGENLRVVASLDGERLRVSLDGGPPRTWEARVVAPGELELRDEAGRVRRAFVAPGSSPGEVLVSLDGRARRLAPVDERRTARAAAAHDAALEAPMPGTCREVFVKPGDRVEKGARLLLIEAMKMEHELRAPRAGTVKSVSAKKGDPVAPGAPLLELE
jgi:3-methylcrotonyl-CoA carboxylase alpha subunit